MANLAKMQNKMVRIEAKLAAAQAAGKIAKAGRLMLKMQKLAKKIAKKGAHVQVAAVGRLGGIPFKAAAMAAVGPPTLGRKTYQVQLDKGAIRYLAPSGRVVTLGYTAATAKKKYKTRRRRKRLTQRDKAILVAIGQNPQAAGAIALMQ